MPQDDRDVLEVLKAELNFVQKGGYGRSPREPRRAQLFLEDSPSCMNYGTGDNPSPCTKCVLMQFVPAAKRGDKVPCRHISLTPNGDTLLHLYRGGTEFEIEEALESWLKKTIARLESEKDEKPGSAFGVAPQRA